MENNRPIQNPRIAHVLNDFAELCKYHDLIGACVVVDSKESGFTYQIHSTWNGVIEDETLPLGFRIRIKQEELGIERAKEFAAGTAWTFGSLMDFGTQTKVWMGDLMNLLRKSGIGIKHNPFGGNKLPRFININPNK